MPTPTRIRSVARAPKISSIRRVGSALAGTMDVDGLTSSHGERSEGEGHSEDEVDGDEKAETTCGRAN